MLWTIVGILIVLWLIGFITKFAGGVIHVLLVIAGIVFFIQLLTRKKTNLIFYRNPIYAL